jgi:hypothetical protein
LANQERAKEEAENRRQFLEQQKIERDRQAEKQQKRERKQRKQEEEDRKPAQEERNKRQRDNVDRIEEETVRENATKSGPPSPPSAPKPRPPPPPSVPKSRYALLPPVTRAVPCYIQKLHDFFQKEPVPPKKIGCETQPSDGEPETTRRNGPKTYRASPSFRAEEDAR